MAALSVCTGKASYADWTLIQSHSGSKASAARTYSTSKAGNSCCRSCAHVTLVAAHPIKNAPEDNLLPYGSDAILNEVDGNLTLWKNPNTVVGLPSVLLKDRIRRMNSRL